MVLAAPSALSKMMSAPHTLRYGYYAKVVAVEVVIVEQGQNQLPISQNQLTNRLKKAPCLQPAQLHPVSVRRFPSFRTQPLENLSHYL